MAVRWAERVNEVAAILPKKEPSEFWPQIKAKPAPWPWTVEGHAVGVSDEYRWLVSEPPEAAADVE
jgi:hypothetical protein